MVHLKTRASCALVRFALVPSPFKVYKTTFLFRRQLPVPLSPIPVIAHSISSIHRSHLMICMQYSAPRDTQHIALVRSLIKLAAVFIQDTQVPGSVGFPGRSCRKKKISVVKSSRRESRAVLGVVLLANSEGHIAVLDHVLDLFSHCGGLASGCKSMIRRNSLVRTKRIIQYMTNTGQKTGTLNTSNQLHKKEMKMARVAQYQNLNSGSRRMKGLNSSSCLVGRVPTEPSSISLSISSFEGSNLGCKKARNRFSR